MTDQITFFPSQENSSLEVVQLSFGGSRFTCAEELFSGFNHLYAITFSYGLGFIGDIIKYFDTAEIIIGCDAIPKIDVQTIMAFQTRALEAIKKYKKLISRVSDGSLSFWVAKGLIAHEKIFILTSDTGSSRIIIGSANFSKKSFSGNQREMIGCFENDEKAIEFYMREFEFVKDFCTNEVVKDSLYISSDNRDKVLENLPIFSEVKVKNAGVIIDNDVSEEDMDAIEFAYDVKALADKYAAVMPKLEKSANLKLLTPATTTELIRKYRKAIAEEKVKQPVYPRFDINYDIGTFTFNGEKLGFSIDMDTVREDLNLISEYYSGFDSFIGNSAQMKRVYFQLMNYMFLSPFIARLRYQADRNNFALTLFPLYAVINGPKSAGKSSFMDTVQSIMFGKKLSGISPDVFTKKGMYGLLREATGAPLHIEDITKDRFRDYCGEIVKYDGDLLKEKLKNHPVVIMTANDIHTIKPEYGKRVYYSSVDAQLTNVVAATQHKKMVELRKRISTSFYREYLRRMYPKVMELIQQMNDFVLDETNAEWQPDIFNCSSKVIIEIYRDCGIELPEYVSELSYSDYFGFNSLTQNIKEKIIFEWTHNRKAFKVLRKQNRLEYIAGERAYEANNICDSLPEVLRAKRSGSKVVLQLDEAEKFFGIRFKNRIF